LRGRFEFPFYLSVSIGLAFATSSFFIFAGLYQLSSLPLVVVAIALAAVLYYVIALSIGELASLFPSAIAIRTYFKVAFSNRPSLVLVYLYLVVLVILAGVESNIFAAVVRAIFPFAQPVVTIPLLLTVVMVINSLGLELPRGAQMLTTFGLVVLVLGLAWFGIVRAPDRVAATFVTAGGGRDLALLPAAVGLAFFLFSGFEWVTPVGLRPGAYHRQIPFAMLVALSVLTVAYLSFAIGLAGHLSRQEIARSLAPHVAYFAAVLGPFGFVVAAGVSVLATYSCFNAGVLGGSRLVYAIAREGNLPAWCSIISLRTGVPVPAVLSLGGCVLAASLVLVVFHVQLVGALVASGIVCTIYAAYLLAVIRLRRTAPDRPRPFRTPVPRPLQWAAIAVLALLSVAALLSVPGATLPATAAAAVLALVAFRLASWSDRRTARLERAAEPPRPEAAPPARGAATRK
jgi:amino acid transporter